MIQKIRKQSFFLEKSGLAEYIQITACRNCTLLAVQTEAHCQSTMFVYAINNILQCDIFLLMLKYTYLNFYIENLIETYGPLKKQLIETKNSKFIKMVKLDMIPSLNMKFKGEVKSSNHQEKVLLQAPSCNVGFQLTVHLAFLARIHVFFLLN